jgi:hypothetical protein
MKTLILFSLCAAWLSLTCSRSLADDRRYAAVDQMGVADTPQARLSQQRAVARYPDIGVAGSDLNHAFLSVFKHWKTWKPEQLQRDQWPELVAREAVQVLINRRNEEERQRKIIVENR